MGRAGAASGSGTAGGAAASGGAGAAQPGVPLLRRWSTWRRASLVGVLLLAGLVLLLVRPEVCRDAVVPGTDTTAGTVVRVCEPLALTSPVVALVLVVVALLLLPELAEVEIGGVLTLRRTVEALDRDVQDVRRAAATALSRVEALTSADASARSQAGVTLHLSDPVAVARAVEEQALAREGAAGSLRTPTGAQTIGVLQQLITRGLAELLQQPEAAALHVVGLTYDGDALVPTHFAVDTPPELTRRLVALTESTDPAYPPRRGYLSTAGDGVWLAVHPARLPDDSLVGALGVALVLDGDDTAAGADGSTPTSADPPPSDVSAQLKLAADCFAAMLVLLLQEPPHAPGAGTAEDG